MQCLSTFPLVGKAFSYRKERTCEVALSHVWMMETNCYGTVAASRSTISSVWLHAISCIRLNHRSQLTACLSSQGPTKKCSHPCLFSFLRLGSIMQRAERKLRIYCLADHIFPLPPSALPKVLELYKSQHSAITGDGQIFLLLHRAVQWAMQSGSHYNDQE